MNGSLADSLGGRAVLESSLRDLQSNQSYHITSTQYGTTSITKHKGLNQWIYVAVTGCLQAYELALQFPEHTETCSTDKKAGLSSDTDSVIHSGDTESYEVTIHRLKYSFPLFRRGWDS